MNKSTLAYALGTALLGTVVSAGGVETAQGSAPVYSWATVVNNSFAIPRNAGRYYNSYNPPSVNAKGLVVFRARSTGMQQGPVSGIYIRDMNTPDAKIRRIADRDAEVPYPNNTCYPKPGPDEGEEFPIPCENGTTLSTFNEFPSFPRIAINQDAIATRGNHAPVWTYAIGVRNNPNPGGNEDSETRAGTTGVYVNLDTARPKRNLVTGASVLGAVPEFSDTFAVPGVYPASKFDVFPGAPAITDTGVIAFKGNYSGEGFSKTGVFYRQVATADTGGEAAIELIANSDTQVPNPGDCFPGTTFGSTAPPSAASSSMVFVGLDNEEDPTCGGVYVAQLLPGSLLSTLVGLENKVPGQGDQTFTRLGEGLSYDGRFVGFWGAWGEEKKIVRLYCPQEGNRDRRDFCNNAGNFDPENGGIFPGDTNSICYDENHERLPVCYQEKEVPINQGIFVYDTAGKGSLLMVARAGVGADYDDFVYWNYSGAPPGAGKSEGDAEPARWRSSAFQSVSQRKGAKFRSAFLARKGDIDPGNHVYVDTVDGIYLGELRGSKSNKNIVLTTLVQTGMDGTILDPEAVHDDDESETTPDVPLPIASLALEREALRGRWLAISASMGVEEAGWAGIYLMRIPE